MAADNHLSLEDIQEIFGAVMQVTEKKETASELIPEKETEQQTYEETNTVINDNEDFMRRARELEKEFSKKNEGVVSSSGNIFCYENFGETEKEAMIKMYEEVSEELRSVLLLSISEKAVNNMMLRSLEKTALVHTILKNTNWNSDGRLKENGSVDFERFLKNIEQGKNENIEKAVNAMMELLVMRLKAIKTGTGDENYGKAAAAIKKKLMIIEAGYPKTVSAVVRNKVVEPAIQKIGI